MNITQFLFELTVELTVIVGLPVLLYVLIWWTSGVWRKR